MKKVGYILSIFFVLLLISQIYFRLSDGKPMTNTTALITFLIVVILAGSIGGILKKKWGKKVTMVAVGAVVVTQVLLVNIVGVILGAIVFGALFFAD